MKVQDRKIKPDKICKTPKMTTKNLKGVAIKIPCQLLPGLPGHPLELEVAVLAVLEWAVGLMVGLAAVIVQCIRSDNVLGSGSPGTLVK